MNRNKYLQTLKDGLYLFDEAYQQRKILEVDGQINLFIQTGKTEEEATAEIGDVEEFIQKIYVENHVDVTKLQEKVKKESLLDQIFDSIGHMIDVMSKNSAKANGKIVFDLLLLILLTSLLKIPFLVVRDFGNGLLDVFSSPLVINIWYFVIEILYWILAVFFFLRIFQKWFSKLEIQK